MFPFLNCFYSNKGQSFESKVKPALRDSFIPPVCVQIETPVCQTVGLLTELSLPRSV